MATVSAKRSGRRPGRRQNKLSSSSRFNDENAYPYSPSLSKPSPSLLADVTTPALPLPVETVTGSEEVHPVGLAAVTQWFDGSVKSFYPPTGRSAVRSALQDFSDNSFFSFPSGKSAAMPALAVKSNNESNRRNTSVPAVAVPPQSTQSLVEVLPPNTLKATELVPSVPIVPPRLSASVRQSISGAPPFLANYTSSSAVGLGSAPSSRRTSLSFAGSVDGSVSSSSAALAFPPPSRTSQRRTSALAESAGDFSAMLPDEREFLADVAEFHGLPARASLQSLPPLAESFPPQPRQLQNGAGRRVSLAWMSLDGQLKNVEALTESVGASGVLTEDERQSWLSIPPVYVSALTNPTSFCASLNLAKASDGTIVKVALLFFSLSLLPPQRALILTMTWKAVSTARTQMKREFARIRKLIRAKDADARSLRKKLVALRSQQPKSVVSSPVASPSSGVARVAEDGPSPAKVSGDNSQMQQLLQAKDLELKLLEEQLKRVEMERDEMGGKMKRAAAEMQRMEEQLKRKEERIESMGEEMKRGNEGQEQAVMEMKRMEAEMKRMAGEMKRSEGRCEEVEASRAATQEALTSAVASNSALKRVFPPMRASLVAPQDLMALQAAHIAELKALVLGQTEAIQELTRGSAAVNGTDAGRPVGEEEEEKGDEEEGEEKAEEKEEEAEKADNGRSAEMEELMAMLSHQSAEISALSLAVQASTSALRRTPSPSASPSASPEPNTPLTAKLAVSAGEGAGARADAPAEPGLWRMGLPLLGSPVGLTPSPPGRGEMRVVARIRGNVYGAVPKYGGAGTDGARAWGKMGTVEEEGRGVAICGGGSAGGSAGGNGGGAGNTCNTAYSVVDVSSGAGGGDSAVGGRTSSCSVNGAAALGGVRKLSLGIGRNGRVSEVVPLLALPLGRASVDPVDPVDPVDCEVEDGERKDGCGCAEGGKENAEVDEGEGEGGEEEYEEVQQFFSAPASPYASLPSTPTAAAAAAAAAAVVASTDGMQRGGKAGGGEGVEGRALRETGVNSRGGEGERAAGKGVRSGVAPRWKY
ncbi:unnamed protein product [Closterium sp. Yama58-4]|nr:unnamed protein product [Closterium sp. Yama58-4]